MANTTDDKRCKQYNAWGECVEWSTVGNTPVLSVSESAKSCNPELAKVASENLKKLKILVND